MLYLYCIGIYWFIVVLSFDKTQVIAIFLLSLENNGYMQDVIEIKIISTNF